MVGQHWSNIGWMCCVCWVASKVLYCPSSSDDFSIHKLNTSFCLISGTGTWLDSFSDNKNVYFIAFDNDKEYDPPYQGFVRFWTYVILYQVKYTNLLTFLLSLQSILVV